MSDERVWLRHPDTDGYFHAPAGAVDDWQAMGWKPSDPPPAEPSAVVAEHLAWREGQQAGGDDQEPERPAKSRTSKATRAGADDTTGEMSNG